MRHADRDIHESPHLQDYQISRYDTHLIGVEKQQQRDEELTQEQHDEEAQVLRRSSKVMSPGSG